MNSSGGPIDRMIDALTRVLGALIEAAGSDPPWLVRQVLWGCVVVVALSIAALCVLLPLGFWLLVHELLPFK